MLRRLAEGVLRWMSKPGPMSPPPAPERLVGDLGRWMRRVEHEHVCTPPLLGEADRPFYAVGSQWGCPCGSILEIVQWAPPPGREDRVPHWKAICGSVVIEPGAIVIVNPTPASAQESMRQALRRVGDGGDGSAVG